MQSIQGFYLSELLFCLKWRTLCVYLAILAVTLTASTTGTSTSCDELKCVYGECRNISGSLSCVCDQGWHGNLCDKCSGRQILHGRSGYITDGDGNYTLDTKCTWLIESNTREPIRLRFQHFATECSWDHMYIYDGMSVWNETLAVLSGLISPLRQKQTDIPEITAASGYAYIHFYSDVAYTMKGFNISYTVGECPLNCSGHGICDTDTLTCSCDSPWTGDGCDINMCPNNCNADSGQGTCDGLDIEKYCDCENNWRGIDCSIPSNKGAWEEVKIPTSDNKPDPRASHASVHVSSQERDLDLLIMIQGYDFGKPDFQDVVKFYLGSKLWSNIVSKSDVRPRRRYGHSAALHNVHDVYMYGGLIGNDITDELWKFDLDTDTWRQIEDIDMSSESISSHRLAVVGHSSHVIGDTLYIIFGYSPKHGYCNYVQKYSITSNTWEVMYGGGAIVEGGYGHSSVYYEATNSLYVHAGYYSIGNSKFSLTDNLYSFNVETESWKILRRSGQYKYLHTAVILNDLMLVFGGNIHNDTSHSQGAKCYSTDFMVYDIECDRWSVLDDPLLNRDIARFGHSANVVQNKLYIFGGFSGFIHDDMYKYSPGSCSAIDEKEECLVSREGIKCSWTNDNECRDADEARQGLINKYIEQAEFKRCDDDQSGSEAMCRSFRSCPSCVENNYNCMWCASKCVSAHSSDCEDRQSASSTAECLVDFSKDSQACHILHTCQQCLFDDNCLWNSSDKKCNIVPQGTSAAEKKKKKAEEVCPKPCQDYTTCDNCTLAKKEVDCMWCVSEKRCVDSNSYVPSFPYGQCMEWTMMNSKCPSSRCEGQRTCSDCLNSPQCGWCDDGSETGLGSCMEGSLNSPNNATQCPNSWYFTTCPLCQCNGHSNCTNGTDICENCQDFTTGSECHECQDGYWGEPVMGGSCSLCSCNDHADLCNITTGECFCRTYGMVGEKCTACDEAKSAYGNPLTGGTCHINLTSNFIYTYPFPSESTPNYHTNINFFNVPRESNIDVEFKLNCSGGSWFNLTVVEDGTVTPLVSGASCMHQYRRMFSRKDFKFGGDSNTTIYVYVYFEQPCTVKVSFSQLAHMDLIQFFVTFFSCFLSLLLIAAIFWKIKQKYDLYRRRRRLVVEMEQMASRPFSSVHLEIEDRSDTSVMIQPPVQATDQRASSRRRHKLTSSVKGPSPVSLEPLLNQKAAVLSLVMRLPCGDEDYAPAGQAGISIGSTLVQLGNARKPSTDHSRFERGTKGRKSKTSDNCA